METTSVSILVGVLVFLLVDYLWKVIYRAVKQEKERQNKNYETLLTKIFTIKELLGKKDTNHALYLIHELAHECLELSPKLFIRFNSKYINQIGEIIRKKNNPQFEFNFPFPSQLSYDLAFDGQQFGYGTYYTPAPEPESEPDYCKEIEAKLLDYFNVK